MECDVGVADSNFGKAGTLFKRHRAYRCNFVEIYFRKRRTTAERRVADFRNIVAKRYCSKFGTTLKHAAADFCCGVVGDARKSSTTFEYAGTDTCNRRGNCDRLNRRTLECFHSERCYVAQIKRCKGCTTFKCAFGYRGDCIVETADFRQLFAVVERFIAQADNLGHVESRQHACSAEYRGSELQRAHCRSIYGCKFRTTFKCTVGNLGYVFAQCHFGKICVTFEH